MDAAGRVIYTQVANGSNTSTVQVSNLAAGIYYIKLEGEEISVSSKLMKK